jgi:NAD(P)-dependent dehydrogenase (short-subunit alcohol dehydrogenase family)
MNIDQKKETPVCLITGGSSGIGLATAELFAQRGFRVAICGRRADVLEQARARVASLTGDPAQVFAQVADLTQADQACQLAEAVLHHWGRIDVLVNNAAAAPLAPFDQISADDFEQTLNLNLRSLFYLTQRVWKQMKHQNSTASQAEPLLFAPVIVNISSLSAVDPFPGFSIYGASKAWLDLLTQALGGEGQELGIRIYSIRPGAVETPLLRGLFPDFPADQCAPPQQVAQLIWDCVANADRYPSGSAVNVTPQ